ncbi:hypothetical protein JCM5353_008101, partial [Sporobolomyces roseus]
MRSFSSKLLALTALFTLSFAHGNDLPPHSIAPTASFPSTSSLHLFPRGSSTLDSAAAALESSVLSFANSASKAVRGQGVCSSNGTCAGFIHFAKTCSEKEDSTAIASCICSASSLEVMNACSDCQYPYVSSLVDTSARSDITAQSDEKGISSNSVKINANHFSSFCNTASSTLAILAASATPTAIPSALIPSPSSHDEHSGA